MALKIDNAIVNKIVQVTGDLPAMPHIAQMILQKVSDPNTTAKDLQKVISGDQALAAKVLKISNSSFYGVTRSITTLSDAIVILGFNTIKSLALAVATQRLYKGGQNRFGLTDKLLWEHSVGVAMAARILARKVRYTNAEEAFLGGLLHDIGKLVINTSLSDKFMEIMQKVYNTGASFKDTEDDILGFNHTQVGALVVDKWRFAEEYIEAILYHHSPEKATISPILSHLLSLANNVCIKLEIGPQKNSSLVLHETTSAKYFSLTEEQLDEYLSLIQDTINAEKDSFNM